MTHDEAKADLEAKVKELLERLVERGMEKLETLEKSNHADVIGDHAEDMTYITAMNFICAFADDVKWNHKPRDAGRAWNHLIKTYYQHM